MSLLSQKHLQNEDAAYAWVEAHVWPNGPVCPHCGETKRINKMQGKATRKGLHKCYACRKQFNVKVGTIFEKSHVPMHLWLQAFYLICGSKKGISSNQLHRTLGVTLKTAWFMGHRIREALRAGSLSVPMGNTGGSGVVEVDETFIGNKSGAKHQGRRGPRGHSHKNVVLSLVERGGKVRSVHVDDIRASSIIPVVRENVAKEARIMTDDAGQYRKKFREYADHGVVRHGVGEYVRDDIHTNTVEGYFSVFKRGMKGVYQHCSEKHLHRYLAEFDFRYSNRVGLGIDDEQRTAEAVKGIVGKRLTYQTTN